MTPDGVTITTENELAGKDNKYDLKAKVRRDPAAVPGHKRAMH